MPYSACVRCANCDGFPCVVHAKSDAEVLGVRPALEHANVTLLTNAKAVKLETNDAGTSRDRGRGRARRRDGAFRGRRRRRRLRRREHGQAAARARRTTSTRTASRTAPTRSGATTCSTTARPCSRSRVRRTRPSSRRRSGSTTSTSASDDFEYPLGNIQMVGKSQAEMFRGEKPGETKLAPEWTLERVAKHAIDFWLSTEDLPLPDNRVTVDQDGKLTLSYTATNDVPKQKLYDKLRSMLGKLDLNAGHLIHRFAYMKNEIPVAGVRAPGRHLPVRHRPGDVGARRRLPGARGRQPLRRRHELLPEHRRGQPGADGDGQRAPRRRPPARAAVVTRRARSRRPGSRSRSRSATSARSSSEFGGGLRSYAVGGHDLLDGYARDEMCTSGRGQVLIPWPNRLQDGTYEFDGRSAPTPPDRASAGQCDPRARSLVGLDRRRARARAAS